MKIKICFERETHRIARLPTSFQELQDLAMTIFISDLPSEWRFQYIDCENDRIMLGDEAEYQEFLNSEVRNKDSCSAVKLYIVPLNPMIVSQTYSFDSTNIVKAMESDNYLSERFDEEQIIAKRPVPEAEPTVLVVHREPAQEELARALEFERVIPKEPIEEARNFDFYHEALRVFLEQQEENELRIREEERLLREREEDEMVEMFQRKLEGKKKGKGKMKAKAIKPPKVDEIVVVKPEKRKKSKEIKIEEMVQPTIIVAEQLSKPSEPKEKPDLDEMVIKAIEKNMERIALMTSSFLKTQTQENQTQTLQKQEEEEKVPVLEKVEKVEDERAVHRTVRCDGCGMRPLRGNRYKCSVCHNFDFCENCEQNVEHEHAFIKIKFPGQQYAHKSYPAELANRCRGGSHFPVPKKKSCLFKSKRKLEHGDLKISKVMPIVIEPNIETNFSQLKKISIFGEKKEEKMPEEVQIPVEDIVMTEPEKVEEQLYAPKVKEYSGLVHNKAKHMKESLPDVDIGVLLEFIDNAPEDLDLAELLENFRY